jgi:hypothetical protein
MENLGSNLEEYFDFEDLPQKAPAAAGGCLAMIGGFLAFVGFFIAWYEYIGSGLKLATDGDQTLLFCIPCLGSLVVLVGLASAASAFLRKDIPYLKPITGGLLTLLSVFVLCPIFIEQEGTKIGWWCTPLGAVLIVLGGVVALVLPTIIKRDLS